MNLNNRHRRSAPPAAHLVGRRRRATTRVVHEQGRHDGDHERAENHAPPAKVRPCFLVRSPQAVALGVRRAIVRGLTRPRPPGKSACSSACCSRPCCSSTPSGCPCSTSSSTPSRPRAPRARPAAAARDRPRPQSNAKPGGVLFVNVVCGWQIYRLVGFAMMHRRRGEARDVPDRRGSALGRCSARFGRFVDERSSSRATSPTAEAPRSAVFPRVSAASWTSDRLPTSKRRRITPLLPRPMIMAEDADAAAAESRGAGAPPPRSRPPPPRRPRPGSPSSG